MQIAHAQGPRPAARELPSEPCAHRDYAAVETPRVIRADGIANDTLRLRPATIDTNGHARLRRHTRRTRRRGRGRSATTGRTQHGDDYSHAA